MINMGSLHPGSPVGTHACISPHSSTPVVPGDVPSPLELEERVPVVPSDDSSEVVFVPVVPEGSSSPVVPPSLEVLPEPDEL